MHIYEVLKRPIVTEKTSSQASDFHRYTFEVDKRANKHLVKEAVEEDCREHHECAREDQTTW